ncbi:MAG: hypothetical protein M3O34_14305 [Chloroflexota bacterium]|nr:hypothetical protein [Chloroflexota bacterium]
MRLLVVDDDDDIREVLGLILLDLLMPGMGVLKFLESQRGLPAHALVAIIWRVPPRRARRSARASLPSTGAATGTTRPWPSRSTAWTRLS